MLLEDIRPAPKKVKVNGVGGKQMIVDRMGMLPVFFRVYASEETKANVLCFSDVEDLYRITYKHRESFTVHMQERDIAFERREKFYVADWYTETEDTVVAATVQENELLYSKDQVKRAKEAHEFLKNSVYPSLSEAVHLLNDGNVRGGPQLLHADVEQAYRIYGTYPEYIRGKMTRKTVGRVPVDPALRSVEKTLKVYADVGMALQGQLALLRSRGFVPSIVYTDPHSTFRSMTQDFLGVEIDIRGADDYVAKVDTKIRRIKETYRTVKCGLPWTLPQCLITELVSYVVSRLNIRRTSALSENVCPRVLFTGVPVNFKKELKVAIGEAYEGTDNTSNARSAACIALYPANNAAGSWVLWKLETRSKVRRSNFEKLVTTDLVKETMEKIAAEQEREEEQPAVPALMAAEAAEENPAIQQPTAGEEELENSVSENEIEVVENEEEELDADEIGEDQPPETGGPEQPTGVTTTRIGLSIMCPSRFLAVTKVSRDEWKTEEKAKAIKVELGMLFNELKALRAVRRASIKVGTKILKLHMFVVEKYLASGEFDKTKARVVADGRDQDADMYPNKSSPTVAIHSVFTILGMAGSKPWQIVVKIDIKGAFLQTLMSG
jgi:hypothetical protein